MPARIIVQARKIGSDLRARMVVRIAAIIVVGLIGGWLGLVLGGRSDTSLGPADVSLSVRPAWTGDTVVEIPPLGTLELDSHDGPVRIEAQIDRIQPEPARRLIENPEAFEKLTTEIGGQVRHALIVLALKALTVTVLFAALAGFIMFRDWKRTGWAALAAFCGLCGYGLIGGLTFNPQSVVEPRYSGLLASAPSVVGDAKMIVRRFDEYRAQLARLVGNVSRLYTVTSTLPTYKPDPTTVRVLHVSDIHLNPAAWTVIRSVTQQFQIQLIIDSGDLTDHGSRPENTFVSEIESLKIPYVFVRGNHDSLTTQRAVARQRNAVVIDGQMKEVQGLRIFGVGDPRFTPDKTTRDDSRGAADMFAEGQRISEQLRAEGNTPDIVVVHDPAEGEAFNGTVPLVLSGHGHQRSTRLLSTGTRLFVQGSTGAAGLRGLENEQPTPMELSILYFNRVTHRLQGWDDLRLGGLGLTSAQIERKLEPQPDRVIAPPPTPTPSGMPSESPPSTPATPSDRATHGGRRTSYGGRRRGTGNRFGV